VLAVPVLLTGQSRTTTIGSAARFIAEARAGTKRYADQETAIAEGFVRVGVEFPAMGEHWVSLARVMADTVDPARPSVLIYVTVNGAPRLAGVAYTDLLAEGEHPPADPAPLAWHEHNGAVDEESLPLGHHAMHSAGTASNDSLRLSILHAWIWVTNPDGVFVTDNWSLPLARAGIAADPSLPRDAIRALALAADDENYHQLMLRTALALSPDEDAVARRVIASRRAALAADTAELRRTRTLSPVQRDALVAQWDAFWRDLGRALPRRAARLQALRAQL
jgi:hypothetical protein